MEAGMRQEIRPGLTSLDLKFDGNASEVLSVGASTVAYLSVVYTHWIVA